MTYIYSDLDDIFDDAVRLVIKYDKASTSLLQRKFKIGYNRAARIIDQMAEIGILSQADGEHPRDVKIKSFGEYEAIKGSIKKPFFAPLLIAVSKLFEFKGVLNMFLLAILLIVIGILSYQQNQLSRQLSSQNETIIELTKQR